jgi:acetyltransferase-like isoleucine patch superfamily enzyme
MSARRFGKSVARLGAAAIAIVPLAFYRVSALFQDPDKAFHGASQAMSRIPGLPGEFLRLAFYRMTLESCGEDCCISFGALFSKRNARLGDRVYVGTGCTLGLVTLEDDVLLASNVDVLSGAGQHTFDDLGTPIREQGGTFSRVVIGADAWIGTKCVVMADVGRGSVIGAGSVVTKPIPAGSLAVGSPARVVGRRGEARRDAAHDETAAT